MSYFNLIIRFCKGSKTSAKAAENLYKKASDIVNSIPETRFRESVNKLFKPQGATNTYFEDLEKIQKAVQKNAPKEVQQAIANIKSKAASYVAECEEGALSGKVRGTYEYTEEVRRDYETLYRYVIGESEKNLTQSEIFHKYLKLADIAGNLRYASPFDARIGRLKDGVLPKDGILYHGTKHPRSILRTGFSEEKSNQINTAPREFGAGIYLTPDKKIASYFAGIFGRIMAVKAMVTNTAMVNAPQFDGLSCELSSLLRLTGYKTGTKEGNAVAELISKRLFNMAGYDSVYTAHSMASGLFAKSADLWLGRSQSQLVVFDGAKVISNGGKTLMQKIKDELLQICTNAKVIYNIQKMQIKDPIGFLMGM